MGLEVELAEERQYCAKLAERVQQQARELQTKHAEVKELVEYKVLCERRILELQPKHQLPVVREQLGLVGVFLTRHVPELLQQGHVRV